MADFITDRCAIPAPADRYWLKNAHVPIALVVDPDPVITAAQTRDGLVCVDIEVQAGAITKLRAAGEEDSESSSESSSETVPEIDLRRGIVFPGFIDMHTHLDKGHVWERSPNTAGTFEDALNLVKSDSNTHWDPEDLYRRMEFGLKCSYAHGTTAIRTHLDLFGEWTEVSLEVFQALRQAWADRITLQFVSLMPLDYGMTPAAEKLADRVAEIGGILGGFALMNPEIDPQLDRLFTLAQERNLDLDLHTDESGDPNEITLRQVALAALRHEWTGTIVCGHCCSLAVQAIDEVTKTLELVKQANIGIVSLPMCNLFLQDRNQIASQDWNSINQPRPDARTGSQSSTLDGRFENRPYALTPRWRGVTLLHELKYAGVPVAVASDNCRDPFFGFGDHDVLEVLNQSTRIAQLDAPYGDWCCTVSRTPANLLGLSQAGRIGVGLPADLILFRARYFSELLSRSQHDRVVLRKGQPIDTTLPDYSELDDLVGIGK
ncbi:cytosine deaminase [Egbenema bharatensis]|uniref:cytosine deaminase n=1 Tax=Egbenema bharatensis TaxID=3463334 RepID=UPI003A88FC8A